MTEDEAKTKWCPFVRYNYTLHSSNASANRWKQSEPRDEPHALNPVPCRCIGSACMAWRTSSFGETKQNRTTIGFCGLAGEL